MQLETLSRVVASLYLVCTDKNDGSRLYSRFLAFYYYQYMDNKCRGRRRGLPRAGKKLTNSMPAPMVCHVRCVVSSPVEHKDSV
jgi:hypothetical protein